MTQAPLALYPRTPASQRPEVAEQAIAFGLDLLVVDRQLVDDVGVVVQQGLAFGLLDPELDERVLKFAHPRLELLHRWRVTADGLGAGLELLGEVAVLVGQQPPLHACLRGELDHGQLAGRPQRCSRQQPVGGCLDGGPLRVEIRAGHPFSCWPSGWRLWAGVVVLVDDSAQPLEFVVLPLAARLRAERVGGQLGELDSAAAELVDVVVGAGDVLAARLAVGQVWGAAGVVAGGLEAALGLGGVEHAGHAFGGIDLQGRSYRCQAALAGSLCPIWLSTANTSRAT